MSRDPELARRLTEAIDAEREAITRYYDELDISAWEAVAVTTSVVDALVEQVAAP